MYLKLAQFNNGFLWQLFYDDATAVKWFRPFHKCTLHTSRWAAAADILDLYLRKLSTPAARVPYAARRWAAH